MERFGSRSEKYKKRKLVKQKKRRRIAVFIISLFALIGSSYVGIQSKNQKISKEVKVNKHVLKQISSPVVKAVPTSVVEPVITTITISAAGDFTLGTDETFGFDGSFVQTAKNNDFSYFTKGLNDIFINDDLTTVNLETTLTTAKEKREKKFRFKGDPSYVKILELAGVEAVNIANNHTFDYFEKGYKDTIAALERGNIGYFGNDHSYFTTVKDVKIGALGYEGWADNQNIRNRISQDIQLLREQGAQIVIVHFHWGNERQYVPDQSQVSLGKFTIDSGADLVLGHHPHVLQGIEEYKGKFIVYSLGNFMYGGHRNPKDKDTFVFQQTFYLENGVLTDQLEISVIPFSISSVAQRNDYQPTMLTGNEKKRVKEKIVSGSDRINGKENWLTYEKEQAENFVKNE
ncbi:CapA family protein [Bacillus andreraoultii]|uniref:CapA family protein n=1 Tax=Bacillus andreraoultii TaxID=1499685 RepID=UPI0009467C09